MIHASPLSLPPLIQDLGILLVTGGLVSLLFGFLRQPLVVGYLLAGYLIGPNFHSFPHVTETEGIRLWGEIGVLFLLFGLGLEFSFKKLLSMGPASLVAATIEVCGLVVIGTWVAGKFGLKGNAALYVGAMLSISSTTVLLRAFDETRTRSARFAENVLGILIVEDLYAVLLLVLLGTLSHPKIGPDAISGTGAVLGTLFRFGFFLTVVFVVGISLLPGSIRRVQRALSDEMRLVLALGLCFTTVVLASKLGFSPTLGAFIMGSLFAGTREAKRIERLILPLQQLFGAVFFISVGMQIQPEALRRSPGAAVAFLAVVVFGKLVLVTLGSLVAGKPLKPALRSGIAMTQIGEFSFVMASLGVASGVIGGETAALIVMVATVTALTTTYAVRFSKGLSSAIDSRLPSRMARALSQYSESIQRGRAVPEWRRMLVRHAVVIAVNAALIGAIGLFFGGFANHWIAERFGWKTGPRLATLGAAIFLTAPFFWGIAKGGIRLADVRRYWANRPLRPLFLGFSIARAAVFFFLAGFLVGRFFRLSLGFLALATAAGAILIFFSTRVETVYERFLRRFLVSLSESEDGDVEDEREKPVPELAPWEGHIATFEVSFDSTAAGKTIAELRIRERYGVTVTLIERGERKIPVPEGAERIFPRDRLYAIGSEEQLDRFRDFIEVAPASAMEEPAGSAYALESLTVPKTSGLVGRKIRESGIRERANGLVVGVERKGERILNPTPDFRIEAGDLLWVVGNRGKVRKL